MSLPNVSRTCLSMHVRFWPESERRPLQPFDLVETPGKGLRPLVVSDPPYNTFFVLGVHWIPGTFTMTSLFDRYAGATFVTVDHHTLEEYRRANTAALVVGELVVDEAHFDAFTEVPNEDQPC